MRHSVRKSQEQLTSRELHSFGMGHEDLPNKVITKLVGAEFTTA